jgi:hypothetical protein
MLETACFPFRVHCTAPRWSTFQGVSRSFDVILVKDFANSIDILLVWQSFYSGINSHTSKIMSIQSLVCWNEIRDVLFLKRPFENQAFFFFKDPTHVIRNIQSFDCHVFWKQKLTCCKTKMVFFMVLCIHFRLWFRVYLLMVCNEVTFC